MRALFCLLVLILLVQAQALGQNLTQTIRGRIIDRDNQLPMQGATVVITDLVPVKGALTDENGNFRLDEVPVGRHTIVVKFMGYSDFVINEIQLNSAKELVLSLEMEEKYVEAETVEITADEDPEKKNQPLNEMATVSTRVFSVEETNKYAGSWGDPGRMASYFAGSTANNDQRNDIVVRGNSPVGVMYRLDGVEIPNPSHFANSGATGGGISMLNGNTLSNSDFMTGAFPAEYGNATSAVFDLKMRNGNNEKREYMIGVGPNGIEFGAEGPVKKGKAASYLANYRLSSLKLLDELNLVSWIGGVPNFSDASLKFNVPLKHGNLSVFGIGGYSTISFLAKEDSSRWPLEPWTQFTERAGSRSGFTCVSYMHIFSEKTWLRSSVAGAVFQPVFSRDSINTSYENFRNNSVQLLEGRITGSLLYHHKFNVRHSLRAGFTYDHLFYNFGINQYVYRPQEERVELYGYEGTTGMSKAYAQWKFRWTENFTLNAGMHFTHFLLNNSWAAEPRASLRWQLHPKHYVALGYGRHSRMLPPGIYYGISYNPAGEKYYPNKKLDLLRAEHFVLSYDHSFTPNLRIKLETYYQRIWNAPVSATTRDYVSGLNLGADFSDVIAYEPFVSTGSGTNYGIEATIERFFNRNYYFLVTGSLYQSLYEGSDGVERNTAFNGNYVANALAGKEFRMGKNKNHILSFNAAVTYSGGKRVIPIDFDASRATGQTVYIYDQAFSEKLSDYFRPDLRISFRQNFRTFSHEFAIDIKNVVNHKNVYRRYYDPATGALGYNYLMGFFPMGFYRIEF